ncbi:putative zinc finger protein At1g68190 isoform X3 [Vicia villosa]|uniref:putative zinc finger protein At1g68190 isoform X3 n=1 Tax=Vicia villosa TaxID=3911 RepID=UPI00273B877E|nr:putative zinc finger protein At1g68190 isoform X3 [Vicia villosa]
MRSIPISLSLSETITRKLHILDEISMEKVCEFCTALRPLVYCTADAAYLCLSCDAKVHWANELSGRHPRTLVCNSCKCHLAYVQCLDHKMLVCRDCDRNLHDSSSSHCRRAVKTFIGCPSAKEFATLWGFEFKEIEKCVNQNDQFTSDNGSSSRLGQIMFDDQERKTILQQIAGLKRFQLNEENDHSTKINGLHVDEKFNQQAQKSQDFAINLLEEDNPIGELWSQNIQDLGICEEFACQDDFNMPDVDLTFQNYEELFEGDQDPIRVMFGGKDLSCSSLEKDLSVDE